MFSSSDSINNHWRVFGHGEIRWFSSFHETFGFIITQADLGTAKSAGFQVFTKRLVL
jgi:hypothetical protein